jgi:hypothetical protein
MRLIQHLQIFLILVISLTFNGCPYLSEYPLSPVDSAVINEKLLGYWAQPDNSEDSSEVLHILPFNDREYLFFFLENKELSLFRVYSSTIREHSFFNINELQPDFEAHQQYVFAEYQLEGDILRLRFVEDDLLGDRKFDSSQQLLEFISNNIENDSLYGDLEYLTRVPETSLMK